MKYKNVTEWETDWEEGVVSFKVKGKIVDQVSLPELIMFYLEKRKDEKIAPFDEDEE